MYIFLFDCCAVEWINRWITHAVASLSGVYFIRLHRASGFLRHGCRCGEYFSSFSGKRQRKAVSQLHWYTKNNKDRLDWGLGSQFGTKVIIIIFYFVCFIWLILWSSHYLQYVSMWKEQKHIETFVFAINFLENINEVWSYSYFTVLKKIF